VPEVVGESVDDAAAILAESGFDLEVRGPFTPGATVISQDPSPGAEVERGSTVVVRLAKNDD
jgi:serine/threonine-protein kinase